MNFWVAYQMALNIVAHTSVCKSVDCELCILNLDCLDMDEQTTKSIIIESIKKYHPDLYYGNDLQNY